jgi:fumarate reductase flavoprotein subunit
MARVIFDPAASFNVQIPVVIVGAGAAGLVAALAATEAGAEVVVLERDPVPRGSTALSAGLIPAAGTRWQREHKIDDSASLFAGDIQRKAKGLSRSGHRRSRRGCCRPGTRMARRCAQSSVLGGG